MLPRLVSLNPHQPGCPALHIGYAFKHLHWNYGKNGGTFGADNSELDALMMLWAIMTIWLEGSSEVVVYVVVVAVAVCGGGGCTQQW
jgi:hypothetical protein